MPSRAWKVLPAIAALSVGPLADPAKAETALEVHSICRTVAATGYDPQGLLRIAKNDVQSFQCWGAFMALQELFSVAWKEGKENILGFCSPPESTRLQHVRVFQKYVDQNPSESHEVFGVIALRAFQQAYKCK